MDKVMIKQKLGEVIKSNPMKKEIARVSLFGSYARGLQSSKSDIDILVEFKPAARVGYFKLAGMQRNMGNAIGGKVDISTPDSLSKFFKDSVLRDAEVIYEG